MKWLSLVLSFCLLAGFAKDAPVFGHSAESGQSTSLPRRNTMKHVPKRSEIAPEHRWRLEDLFPDQAAWDKEYEVAKELIKQIADYQGKLADPQQLKACFELEDDLSLHTERLYVYANMKHHEDTAEPVYQALADKAKRLSVETNEALSFITPEVLELPDETLDAMIADPSLAKYHHTLKEMRRQKAHILSRSEEALLAQVGNVSQAPGTIFNMLNNADLKFPKVKNEQGEEVELTHGRYIQFWRVKTATCAQEHSRRCTKRTEN
ncbi:hypothetical protein PACILC2_16130 [Paenibacillus cisolokensis]|uniref:Oligopeptidase F N-terminal domain-containing protein n=1 Tax=Paenibacillus cisolokensis TaxID=1658519 RepID=A0ABQ4N4C3_9BACL|nr:hypothetical protein PACILC2_16130 [Paenibacillus cisolokensis]